MKKGLHRESGASRGATVGGGKAGAGAHDGENRAGVYR